MAAMGALSNRVHDIIRRMADNLTQAEATKTCYGILAIMSREDASKTIIAKNGLDIILSGMQTHMDKADVQESGCDLLWSLAFNNSAIKELIGNCNGTGVVVRSLKRHSKSPEFLKSACGALSNLCQFKVNQQGVASHGGLQPLINSIGIHQRNAKLLPFIFDALASLIVGNEENARMVSSQDGIAKILTATVAHKDVAEVVKSGCHALAILSDVKGQASKIAFAGGVASILPLLDLHPAYPDFHRVAAVVLLRMLQESSHVVREIASNDGIRILLKSLDKGGAQQDTVAAITHILSTVTNPLAATTTSIENQLWLPSTGGSSNSLGDNDHLSVGSSQPRRGRFRSDARYVVPSDPSLEPLGSPIRPPLQRKPHQKDVSALLGLVKLMGQYTERKDVARASCRLLNNLIGYAGVIMALDNVGLMDKVFDCVNIHRNTKDILESAASLLKAIHKRTFPAFTGHKISSIRGLMHLVRCKIHDDEVVVASLEMLLKLAEGDAQRSSSANMSISSSVSHAIWEEEAVALCASILENTTTACPKTGSSTLDNSTLPWTKTTPKLITSVLDYLECVSGHRAADSKMCYPQALNLNIQNIMGLIPSRHGDIAARLQRLLPHVQAHMESNALGLDNSHNAKKVSNSGATGNGTGGTGAHRSDGKSHKSQHTDGRTDSAETPTKKKKQQSSSEKLDPADSSPTLPDSGGKKKSTSASGYASRRQQVDRTTNSTVVVVPDDMEFQTSAQPMHPLKFYSQLSESQRSQAVPTLINTYPSFLEALASDFAMSALALEGEGTGGEFAGSGGRGGIGGGMYQQPIEAAMPTRMQLCYESSSPAGRDIISKCPNPVPYETPLEGVGKPFAHSLTFDSEFESGNLQRAVQRGEKEYDLCLRCDVHTPGHTQWFYFAVSNTYPPDLLAAFDEGKSVTYPKYRFNITNLTKPDSLFNQGMRPVVYSCRDAKTKGTGWVRSGSNISYYSNPFTRGNAAGEGVATYFSLSFTLELTNPRDTYLVAYSYPYTYTDNKAHIQQLLGKPGAKDIIKHSVLCNTISGADLDLLVITNFRDKENLGPIYNMSTGKIDAADTQSKSARKKAKMNRKALVISARVHPGGIYVLLCFVDDDHRLHFLLCSLETPASWMMRGALDFLTSNNPNAKLLRQAYVIYVVPMLNPDGVIFGNNRCGLAGVDLNRQWKNPTKSLHPTVFALKTLLQEQKTVREISMYIDLHGHSRKYNIFMYGCEEKKRPNPKVRAFPKFFSLHNVGKKYVSYADCSFHVRKGRESTARVVVSRDIGIPLSYTVEATFCGTDSGALKYCHMNTGHLEEVGIALVDSFIQYAISEGDVSDAVILSSRKNSGSSASSNVENKNLKNMTTSVRNSNSTDNKKEKKKAAASPSPLPTDESTSGNDSGRLEYISDAGDDVVSDVEDDIEDDASCVQSVATGSEGSTRSSTGYALEKSAGTFSLRGVKTAGSDSGVRSPAGIALMSARARSDTAPLAGATFVKDKGGATRLLARDDGFSFSESVSANRMIAGIVSSNKPASAQPAFTSETSDRWRLNAVLYCGLV